MSYKDKLKQWAKEREEIAKMHKSGLSIRDIAQKLGVRDSAVARRLKRYLLEHPI